MDDIKKINVGGETSSAQDCYSQIVSMSEPMQHSVAKLLRQISITDDPDAFSSFVRWRDDEVIEILILLASKLTEPEIDCLIEEAENMISARYTE